MQYFQLFGLEPTFSLDRQALQVAYQAAIALCHPDKFANRNAFEQKQALVMAAGLSDAYRTLNDPVERAFYMLNEYGIAADSPEHTNFASDFLMEQITWRETLEEAVAKSDSAALESLMQEVSSSYQEHLETLAHLFDHQELDKAATCTRQAKFLQQLQKQIAAAQHQTAR